MRARQRLWGALGTAKAVRIISIGMLIYLLVIGGLTYGYAKVSNCLARYADQSATSTAGRAASAAEDRRLNDAERLVDDSDRTRYRADQNAMSRLLVELSNPEATRQARGEQFANLLAVTTETSRVLDANGRERERLRGERQRIEEQRAKNPPPPPPSQTC